MSSELDEIKEEIAATKADLTDAKTANDQVSVISIRNHLTELQKEKNILLAREVRPVQGEPPSNKF
jgi:hypothetical protein